MSLSFHDRTHRKASAQIEDTQQSDVIHERWFYEETQEIERKNPYKLVSYVQLPQITPIALANHRPTCVIYSLDQNPYPSLLTSLPCSDNVNQFIASTSNVVKVNVAIISKRLLVEYYESVIKRLDARGLLDLECLRSELPDPSTYLPSVLAIRRIVSGASFLFLITQCGRVFQLNRINDKLRCVHTGVGHEAAMKRLVQVRFNDPDTSDVPAIVDAFITNVNSFFLTSTGQVWACGPVSSMGYSRYDFSTNPLLSQDSTIIYPVNISEGKYANSLLKDKKIHQISTLSTVMFLSESKEIICNTNAGFPLTFSPEPGSEEPPQFNSIVANDGHSHAFMLTTNGYVGARGIDTARCMGLGDSSSMRYHNYTYLEPQFFNNDKVTQISTCNSSTLFLTEPNKVFGAGALRNHLYSLAYPKPLDVGITSEETITDVFALYSCSIVQSSYRNFSDLSIYHSTLFDREVVKLKNLPGQHAIQAMVLGSHMVSESSITILFENTEVARELKAQLFSSQLSPDVDIICP